MRGRENLTGAVAIHCCRGLENLRQNILMLSQETKLFERSEFFVSWFDFNQKILP